MEDNPYKTPESDLAIEPQVSRSLWWKLYYVFYLFLILLSIVAVVFGDQIDLLDFINTFVSIVASLGLYGYVFSRKIFVRRIWFPVFIVFLLSDATSVLLAGGDFPAGLDRSYFLTILALTWLMSVPAYVALFHYSKQKHRVWN